MFKFFKIKRSYFLQCMYFVVCEAGDICFNNIKIGVVNKKQGFNTNFNLFVCWHLTF